MLASDGYCRPFDSGASGYVRAEGICAIYLQRKVEAKRVYANLIYSKTNCDGYKEEGITYPSGKIQMKLLKEFYNDINFDPSKIGNAIENTIKYYRILKYTIFYQTTSKLMQLEHLLVIQKNVVHLKKFIARTAKSLFQLAQSSLIWAIQNQPVDYVRLQK